MKYLLLCCTEEAVINAMSGSEYGALMDATQAYLHELGTGGHLVAAERLEPVSTATTLRVRNGRLSTTDGPFAETKEQLGGFVLIEARDVNEAIRLAAKFPPARLGSIELRPVREPGSSA